MTCRDPRFSCPGTTEQARTNFLPILTKGDGDHGKKEEELARFYSRKITFIARPFVNEANSGNAAGGRCFVSKNALNRGFTSAGGRLSTIRSGDSLRILRSRLASALLFSS